MIEKVLRELEALEPEMVRTLCDLVALPAVSPADGGTGEGAKADYLCRLVRELGLGEADLYPAFDEESGMERPNLVVTLPGAETGPRLCFVTHMDVVPEGKRELWDTDPYEAVVRDGNIYGRGASDNGQELVVSLYALAAMKRAAVVPPRDVVLVFVADEERGSKFGIQHLISEDLFRPDDLVVVPDGGNEKGDFVEVAEKGILWLKFRVLGKQVHASSPNLGLNACRVANSLACELDRALHLAFPEEDSLFEPPVSTFEPTWRSANVANVNTIPGEEAFAFDCRVLPSAPLDEVMKVVETVTETIRRDTGAGIEISIAQRGDAAEPTSTEAPVVTGLVEAISEVYGSEPRVLGIGGGSCAAFFRNEGIPAVVWAQENDSPHQPNEYAEIEHLRNEARVFARMMLKN